MKIFENTTALAASHLTDGQMVSVKEVGDYRIKTSGTGITLANGNIAVPVASGTTVNVKQYGAIGDGVTDDSVAAQLAWDSSDPQAVFIHTSNIRVDSVVTGKFYSFGAVTVSGAGSINITNLVP